VPRDISPEPQAAPVLQALKSSHQSEYEEESTFSLFASFSLKFVVVVDPFPFLFPQKYGGHI